jgi:hypothetical protein
MHYLLYYLHVANPLSVTRNLRDAGEVGQFAGKAMQWMALPGRGTPMLYSLSRGSFPVQTRMLV